MCPTGCFCTIHAATKKKVQVATPLARSSHASPLVRGKRRVVVGVDYAQASWRRSSRCARSGRASGCTAASGPNGRSSRRRRRRRRRSRTRRAADDAHAQGGPRGGLAAPGVTVADVIGGASGGRHAGRALHDDGVVLDRDWAVLGVQRGARVYLGRRACRASRLRVAPDVSFLDPATCLLRAPRRIRDCAAAASSRRSRTSWWTISRNLPAKATMSLDGSLYASAFAARRSTSHRNA